MKLKIFADRRYLPKGTGHVVMLYPFWGKCPEDPKAPESGRFDGYMEIGHSCFEMTQLTEADLTVLPAAWEEVLRDHSATDLAIQFSDQMREAGKQVVVFFCSDSDEDVGIENAVVFRTSLYRAQRKPNEFSLPAWSEDFVARYLENRVPIRRKHGKPVVGFCGFAAPLRVPIKRKIRDLVGKGLCLSGIREKKQSPSSIGQRIRSNAMRYLIQSPEVETNFIVRDRFLGGVISPDGSQDLEMKRKMRQEYVRNMLESDYILCARGKGNFSYRLYETLSCGRIPIIVDTDCVFPFDFAVEWKNYGVWVDERDLPSIADKVTEFHANLSPKDFMDLQYGCRKLWEEWLSPQGFFASFYRHFQEAP